jgi:two-component system KDP operon response regulator KdpE
MAETERDAQVGPILGAPRILVVDDEPQMLRVLRPALAAAGYEALFASTGREALRAIAASARPRREAHAEGI